MNIDGRRSIAKLAVGLTASILLCITAGAIGGMATTSSVDGWYSEVIKPPWNPPNWIFGPVWSILYLMMGVSAWLIWKDSEFKKANLELGWFAFHLVLNVLWSVIFFGLKSPGWAAIEIVFLWISIAVSILLFFRRSKLAAILLVPYLAWVTFAMFLNYAIWSLNRGL